MKYRNVLWTTHQNLLDRVWFYYHANTDPYYIDTIWESRPVIGQFTPEEGQLLLSDTAYLVSLSRGAAITIFNCEGDLPKPTDFSPLVKLFKLQLEFNDENDASILRNFKGKDRVKTLQKLRVQRLGLLYYINKLQDPVYLDTLPDMIYTYDHQIERGLA